MLLTSVSNQGSYKPAHPCNRTRAFTARTHKVGTMIEAQLKSETSSPTRYCAFTFKE